MSWIQKLCEVYNACEAQGLAGKRDKNPMLLPLYHTTLRAQLEVTIDQDGNWLPGNAAAIAKDDQETLVMVTEKSGNRTSSPEPMPLFDKLIYLAGDYQQYCPQEKNKEKDETPYTLYVKSLRQWCASPCTHPDIQAWLRYIQKGCLIADLISEGLFELDEDGRLREKWKGSGKAADVFVRIRVQQPDGNEEKLWMKPDLSEQFIAYQNSLPVKDDLCYAMGRAMPASGMSPKYIRYPGDGAKLISANDSGGFTFRGRFQTAEEAYCIGRETTEKAHAALKYLISRQAYRNGDQVILTFGTGGTRLPGVEEDTAALADCALTLEAFRPEPEFSLKEGLAREVRKALAGYQNLLDPRTEAIVIGLDSATTGRLSIFYYRELTAEDFFARILKWHTTCAWEHRYLFLPNGTDETGKTRYRRVVFYGAPAPMDIVEAAYGSKANDKLKKSAVERLLPCIIDGARLPRDIVSAVARRAAQRGHLSEGESDKALSIACALIRKAINDFNHEEVWDMALQPEVKNRSYLFGRAWAYAEAIEQYALRQAGENRSTNAERLMTAFPRHPKRSWGILMERLRPYQLKLGARAGVLNNGMDAVIAQLETTGFTDDMLDETYLLGYACQRQAFAAERAQRLAGKTELKNENEEE